MHQAEVVGAPTCVLTFTQRIKDVEASKWLNYLQITA